MDVTVTFLEVFVLSVFMTFPLLIALILIIMSLGQIVSKLEKWNRFDGLYWSFVTATTVGYGDFRPLRKSSKSLSVLIALVGMMFTGIIIAITLRSAETALAKYPNERIIEMIKETVEKAE